MRRVARTRRSRDEMDVEDMSIQICHCLKIYVLFARISILQRSTSATSEPTISLSSRWQIFALRVRRTLLVSFEI